MRKCQVIYSFNIKICIIMLLTYQNVDFFSIYFYENFRPTRHHFHFCYENVNSISFVTDIYCI